MLVQVSHLALPRFKGRELNSPLNGRVTKSLCIRIHGVGDAFVGIFGNSDLPLQATLFFLSERIWRHAIRLWIGEHGNKTQEVG